MVCSNRICSGTRKSIRASNTWSNGVFFRYVETGSLPVYLLGMTSFLAEALLLGSTPDASSRLLLSLRRIFANSPNSSGLSSYNGQISASTISPTCPMSRRGILPQRSPLRNDGVFSKKERKLLVIESLATSRASFCTIRSESLLKRSRYLAPSKLLQITGGAGISSSNPSSRYISYAMSRKAS